MRKVFWYGNLRERDRLEDQAVDGWKILKWICKKHGGGVGWIDLAHDRDTWRSLLNEVMTLLFPYNGQKWISLGS